MGCSDFISMGIEEMSGGVLGGVLKGFAEGGLKGRLSRVSMVSPCGV